MTAAAAEAGLDAVGAQLIRRGENDLWRLPGGVVARVGRRGQVEAAAKELAVSRWLANHGVSVVRALDEVPSPVSVDGRAVTFWHELPPHAPGTTADVAAVLARLHRLTPPTDFRLPDLAPFVRLTERIEGATAFTADQRAWLHGRLAELRQAYSTLPVGMPYTIIHGDAWRGNIVVTNSGDVVLMDLERCCFGPPEWDLVSTAVSHGTTGWMSPGEWERYCTTYGSDVTRWAGYQTLRDIRELRMVTSAGQAASEGTDRHTQAVHRLACLMGERGSRPWPGWTPLE